MNIQMPTSTSIDIWGQVSTLFSSLQTIVLILLGTIFAFFIIESIVNALRQAQTK